MKSFLISSAICWLDRYHVDGLRVDGVASMLYRDYSRKPGEWVPNEDGSNHDRDAIAFLQEFNRAVYARVPRRPDDRRGVDRVGRRVAPARARRPRLRLQVGPRLDARHAARTSQRDPIHRRYHHDELTFRAIYANSENYVLPLSHDEVVHGKGSLLGKIPGDPWQKYATLRLLYGYQWTLPGKKLLFMGGELGVWSEWNHDDAARLGARRRTPAHAGIARWVGDLNARVSHAPGAARGDCEPVGLPWLVGDDREHSVLAYLRTATPAIRRSWSSRTSRRCRATATASACRAAGFWREMLNSDAEIYGGSGIGNRGGDARRAGRAARPRRSRSWSPRRRSASSYSSREPRSAVSDKWVCIHGHFYQPPRENPWLEAIEPQPSAHPYRDWNERITAECYRPNTAARVVDGTNQIIQIVDNYAAHELQRRARR